MPARPKNIAVIPKPAISIWKTSDVGTLNVYYNIYINKLFDFPNVKRQVCNYLFQIVKYSENSKTK